MESNYNNKDFEQFVKQNADQYRMFPSEKVWRSIHSALHTRRRWYGIAFGLLLLTGGAVTWVMLSSPPKDQQASDNPVLPEQINNSVVQKKIQVPVLLKQSAQSIKRNIPFNTNTNDQQTDLFSSDLVNTSTTITEKLPAAVSPIEAKIVSTPVFVYNYNKETSVYKPIKLSITGYAIDNNKEIPGPGKQKETSAAENNIKETKDIYSLSIERVANSPKLAAGRKRISWELFFTPTISYRKLVENKAFLREAQLQTINSPFTYAGWYDINSVVTHKPDMGLELGFAAGYPLSKNLKLTAGLQFNVSKYDIRAFIYPNEVTTIALNTGSGTNSVSAISNYRNLEGYRPSWLHNLYLSASLPVGTQLKLTGNKKNYLGIGGTVQPTYILGDRAYLLSTDFKNYAEIPWLIRRWNLTTSFEVFAGYSTGKIKWKVGPQVRYQWLSSFQEKYPVKEHLFDFGLKVGILLNQ